MRIRTLLVPMAGVAVAVSTALAQDASVLVTVNGTPIKRAEAVERAWKQYGTAVLNLMADDILVNQAAAARKVKADAKEVDARLKRIRDQFADEATFKSRLEASGTTLAALKAQIEDQVMREALVTKAKDLKVTDAEVKDFFEANKDKLASAESVHLRHILVAGEKEANDFLVAIKAGADFARLASQVSQDAATRERGGDLGFIAKGLVIPEIEKAAFALKAGEVSPVVKTQLGFHILKVDEVRAPKPAVFDAVKKDLKAAILADKISKAWPGFLQELRDKAKYESPAPAGAAAAPKK